MYVFFTLLIAVFTGLVAFFTCRLVAATKRYTEATERLLKQSQESLSLQRMAFDNQRRAYVSDAISKVMFSGMELLGGKYGKEYSRTFVVGMLNALRRIDNDVYQRAIEGLTVWRGARGAENLEWLFIEVLGKKAEQKN